jgi:hypothetical protein
VFTVTVALPENVPSEQIASDKAVIVKLVVDDGVTVRPEERMV